MLCMKGPYQRLKFDLRRLWECPVCHYRVHTPGDVTTQLCRCQEQVDPANRRFMHLMEATPPQPKVATPTVSEATPPENVITDSLPSPD